MKQFSLPLTFAICLMAGCTNEPEYRKAKSASKYWQVIEIDGCEYIENSRWNDVPLTHKGNCNNPIHKK